MTRVKLVHYDATKTRPHGEIKSKAGINRYGCISNSVVRHLQQGIWIKGGTCIKRKRPVNIEQYRLGK